jgi:hypothetical protein
MAMEELLQLQQILVQQAQRWQADEIDRIYRDLSNVAKMIAGLWMPEDQSHD